MPSPSPSNGSTTSSTSLVSEGRKSTTSAGNSAQGGKKFGKSLISRNFCHFWKNFINHSFSHKKSDIPQITTEDDQIEIEPKKSETLKPGLSSTEIFAEFENSEDIIRKKRPYSIGHNVNAVKAAQFLLQNYNYLAPKCQDRILKFETYRRSRHSSENEEFQEKSNENWEIMLLQMLANAWNIFHILVRILNWERNQNFVFNQFEKLKIHFWPILDPIIVLG